MSAPIIVTTAEELAKLIEAAVARALANGSSVRRSEADAWVSIKSTGLPPTTVRRLIRDGKLRSLKIGRELRVSSEDLRAHLLELEEKQKAKKAEPEPAVVPAGNVFDQALARAKMRRAS